jgi:uncharacterized protein
MLIGTKKLFWIAGVFFLVGVLLVSTKPQRNSCPPEYDDIKIGNAAFSLECSISAEERTKGLSGRKNLPEDTGLLFVFERPGLHRFWMKDMNFPIDILWLDENKRIVHIEKDVPPESYPEYFVPTADSKYVLELNAGQVQKNNIKLGDIATF